MRERLRKFYHNIWSKHIEASYEKINVEWWECTINFKCHWNAFHWHKKKWAKIVSVYALHNWFYVAHFINKVWKKYIDNTVWMTWFYTQYFKVKEYKEGEFYPDVDLWYLKDMIFNIAFNNPFVNWLFNFTSDEF